MALNPKSLPGLNDDFSSSADWVVLILLSFTFRSSWYWTQNAKKLELLACHVMSWERNKQCRNVDLPSLHIEPWLRSLSLLWQTWWLVLHPVSLTRRFLGPKNNTKSFDQSYKRLKKESKISTNIQIGRPHTWVVFPGVDQHEKAYQKNSIRS